MDKFVGCGCGTGRKWKRGSRFGSPGNQCNTRGALPYCRGGSSGGSRSYSNQLKGWKAEDASKGWILGWPAGPNLRGLQYVNYYARTNIGAASLKLGHREVLARGTYQWNIDICVCNVCI